MIQIEAPRLILSFVAAILSAFSLGMTSTILFLHPARKRDALVK